MEFCTPKAWQTQHTIWLATLTSRRMWLGSPWGTCLPHPRSEWDSLYVLPIAQPLLAWGKRYGPLCKLKDTRSGDCPNFDKAQMDNVTKAWWFSRASELYNTWEDTQDSKDCTSERSLVWTSRPVSCISSASLQAQIDEKPTWLSYWTEAFSAWFLGSL